MPEIKKNSGLEFDGDTERHKMVLRSSSWVKKVNATPQQAASGKRQAASGKRQAASGKSTLRSK